MVPDARSGIGRIWEDLDATAKIHCSWIGLIQSVEIHSRVGETDLGRVAVWLPQQVNWVGRRVVVDDGDFHLGYLRAQRGPYLSGSQSAGPPFVGLDGEVDAAAPITSAPDATGLADPAPADSAPAHTTSDSRNALVPMMDRPPGGWFPPSNRPAVWSG